MCKGLREGWHRDPLGIYRFDLHMTRSATVRELQKGQFAWTAYRRTPYKVVAKGNTDARHKAMKAAEKHLRGEGAVEP